MRRHGPATSFRHGARRRGRARPVLAARLRRRVAERSRARHWAQPLEHLQRLRQQARPVRRGRRDLATIIRPRIAPLLDPSNSPSEAADALIRYFTALAETVAGLPADSPRQGCLLVTAAPGIAGHDETVRQVVADYHAELVAAFTAAIERATGVFSVAPERAGASAADEAQVAAAQSLPTNAENSVDPKSVSRARLLASLSVSAFALAKVDRGESVVLLHTGADFATEWTEPAHLQRF
jgi:TetR/AcrR family transcriptional repressor of nem operon